MYGICTLQDLFLFFVFCFLIGPRSQMYYVVVFVLIFFMGIVDSISTRGFNSQVHNTIYHDIYR